MKVDDAVSDPRSLCVPPALRASILDGEEACED